jgi:DNA-binding LacI/PurR family transcriptional regulator
LLEKKEEYSYYVIIPFFQNGGQDACEIINAIPKEKLILLDRQMEGVTGCYGAAWENFENDIYCAMHSARERLAKYDTIKIIFPNNSYYSRQILKGLSRFCSDFGFRYKAIENIQEEPIRPGEVYINLMDDDLVLLIERLRDLHFIIGQDVGIISYNETPLKRIILNGITTISTDFHQMGRMAAKLIMNRSREQLAVPFHLNLRESL